jgi:hypothetical protein
MKINIILLTVLTLFGIWSCNKEKLFEQPTVQVNGFTLKGLPGEYTDLDVDISVINNDKREAKIKDVEYTVVIEGFTAETEQVDVNKMIYTDEPLDLTLPLRLRTKDAVQLLMILDAGQELSYTATGTFHVDEPVKNLFDLPLNVEGTAIVDVGFEDFYEQPEVTVNAIDIVSSEEGSGTVSYTFDVDCTVENMDTRSVLIDEVEYVVTIEGIESTTHLYSDSYATDLAIPGNGTVDLTLPVTIIMNSDEEAAFNTAVEAGTIDYIVEGTFHAIQIESTSSDFLLPLYVPGSINVESLFEQPEITVNTITGTYSIVGTPVPTGVNFDLDANSTIQNMDNRSVVIDEVEYVVTIEGVVSNTHWYSDTYSSDLTITGSGSVNLALPVILNLGYANGLTLADGLLDGTANYIIEGTFHAVEVDGVAVDLNLPLYDEGSCPATVVELK